MRYFAALSAFVLALTSCTAAGDLTPRDVLERSAAANRSLDSARFNMQGEGWLPAADGNMAAAGSFSLEGVLQEGGKQLQFTVDAQGRSGASGGESGEQWRMVGDVIVAGEGEWYIRIHPGTSGPFLSADDIRGLEDAWVRLPASDALETAPIAPDPRILQLQTEVLDVSGDRGVISRDGYEAYVYDVRLNEDKLASFLRASGDAAFMPAFSAADARGTVWIETETFLLRRAEWIIGDATGDAPYVRFTLDISDPGAGLMIVPPSSAISLPLEIPSV